MPTRTPAKAPTPGRRHPPTPIDHHVAARVKQRRRALKLSAGELGEMLGVSEQQMRKYESLKDRLTAGRLYHLSLALNVPVSFFFEDLAPEALTSLPPALIPLAHRPRSGGGGKSRQ